ncbi:MAG: lipid biosynthesis acyltransferase [Herminiimonas sp.]|nr:lipid biosynthesis acyltransferase [Herminiimonas sp.]
MLMLRTMSWISLRLGRRAGRAILHLIAGYFLLFARNSKAGSRDYLRRILKRPVRWTDIYRHFFWFASTIHDRIYLLNQRFDLFEIDVHGEELMQESIAEGQGLFLIGAHIGSFEVIRALGRRHAGLRVAMAMYEENARKINRMLAAINPAATQDMIALGRIDSMLKINAHLDQGTLVGMLADRTLGDDITHPVPLLGSLANLPLGPFRMAAILRRPVIFMVGLYLGGNRYEIHFEKLADFSSIPHGQRQTEIHRAMTRYAELLEQYCRRAPYNWFNFFNFWQTAQTIDKED